MNKFDKYLPVIEKYMPAQGEGNTMASQIVTAVNKLVYKWYNDGDVFDNTYSLEGWANDLSSYANWLFKYTSGCDEILDGIVDCCCDEDYEGLLEDLAALTLNVEYLTQFSERDVNGSIYDCEGPFQFVWQESEYYDDEEDYY